MDDLRSEGAWVAVQEAIYDTLRNAYASVERMRAGGHMTAAQGDAIKSHLRKVEWLVASGPDFGTAATTVLPGEER